MTYRKLQILTMLIAIGFVCGTAPYLPERVATHFNIHGEADGFSTITGYVVMFCVLVLLVNTIFIGVTFLLRKLPASMVNIPNREYWLAPERREETIAKISESMSLFTCAVNALVIAIIGLTFYANRHAAPLPPILLFSTLGLFFLFVVFWLIRLLRAFRGPQH
jgi:uncharacterized membrane protein